MPTVLTLDPASGGQSFGPFSGVVTVGADARCQVLVGDVGVLGVHARVTERPGGWTLEPGTPGAPLFASRRSARNAPVTGPIELVAGDSFALGHAGGVRFTVGGQPMRPVAKAGAAAGTSASPSSQGARARSGPGRGPPTGGAIAAEVRRQAEVEAMRLGPLQDLRRLLFRANAGTLFQPRYIVAALFAFGGGAFVACAGVVTWVVAHLR